MSDAAIASIVTGAVTIVGLIVGFLKLKYGQETVAKKLEQNTILTEIGTGLSVTHAKVAAENATEAKQAAESISRKLNGGLDETVSYAIAPIKKAIEEHAASDERNMGEINNRFKILTEYVHQRNHDLLNVANVQSLKLDILLKKLGVNPIDGSEVK